jgi:phenylacetate-coenzyme A ligase PaaK-like adenylate-forming protein
MSTLISSWQVWRDGRDGASLSRHQRSRLVELVAAARSGSPYYRALYRRLSPDAVELSDLPVTSKPELMDSFDDWVTDARIRRADVEVFVADPRRIGQTYLGRYLVFITSGTTGSPALLLQDPFSIEVLQACLLVRTLPQMLAPGVVAGVIRGGGRAASVWATGRSFGGAALLQRQINQRPSRAKRLRLFSALRPVHELVAELNAFQPVMLSGYATVLSLLAHEQRAGRLQIHPVLVNNGGETLTRQARGLIGGAFGTRVSNGYGCSEMIALAYDCGHGSMHVHADWALLEPVDENRQPVPPGHPSATVLLTNLANRVQPLIRYDLGDSVTVLTGPCTCGSVLPRIDVVGRTNDMLSFTAPGEGTVQIPPLPLVTLVEAVPGVRSVQLVQQGAKTLAVRLDVLPGTDRAQVWQEVAARLQAHLVWQAAGFVACVLAAEPPRRNPGSGKLRQVIADGQPAGQRRLGT